MQEPKYFENPTVDWFTPSDFDDNRKILTNSKRKLNSLAIKEGKAKLYNTNSLLLVGIGATIGKIGLISTEASSNQQITALEFKELVNPFYAYYWFKFLKPEIIKSSSAATLPIINQNGIKQLPFLLPPSPEQTRIVNKLDALFSRIDKSIELLEENVNYTKASSASVIEAIFSYTTKRIQISDLVEKTKNINPSSQQAAIYNYIDISSVNNEEHKIGEPKQISGKEAPSRARKHVVKGDVLFATTRPNLKNIALLEQDYENAVASTGFCILRVKKRVSNNFLFLCLLSNNIQDQIKPKIRGAQYPAISDKDLFNCFIPDLELETQIKLSNRIQNTRLLLSKLLIEQQSKLTYLKALKASILDKAFKGEL